MSLWEGFRTIYLQDCLMSGGGLLLEKPVPPPPPGVAVDLIYMELLICLLSLIRF